MFVRSIRMRTLQFATVAALAVFAIAALAVFLPKYESPAASVAVEEKEIRFDKIKTDADRRDFLKQFGYTVEETAVETVEVQIPREFDKVFAAYNALQKKEGLDLGRYKGKTVTRYTYKVVGYEGYADTVYASVLVYKNKVIAADVCSADPRGFAHGLTRT